MRLKLIAVRVTPGAALAVVLLLGFAASASASDGASVTLVKEIRPGHEGSNPGPVFGVGGGGFFAAKDARGKRRLWVTDGTSQGTKELLTPGADAPLPYHRIVGVDGEAFFAGVDSTHGLELWRSDGTRSGTRIVKDIAPGSEGSVPNELTALDGVLFFVADDGVHGPELWRSNGSASGTYMVKDITPGNGLTITRPRFLTAAGSNLYFADSDLASGNHQLWSSDGTESGTSAVTHINPSGDFGPGEIAAIGDIVYFSADDGVHGVELWRSNGSELGTTMVTDINPGDGSSWPDQMAAIGDELYFSATDGVHGSEPWRSNGSEAGTAMVADINPAPNETSESLGFTRFGGEVLFSAGNGIDGREPYVTDGTPAGTHQVDDGFPGVGSSVASDFAVLHGRAYFEARNVERKRHFRLWATDGTAPGTRQVPAAKPPLTLPNANPVRFHRRILFRAKLPGHGFELWKLKP